MTEWPSVDANSHCMPNANERYGEGILQSGVVISRLAKGTSPASHRRSRDELEDDSRTL